MTRRDLKELSTADSLRLLASVPLGRVVFTRHALPAIRPVNHIVADGQIVIRSSPGTILSAELAALEVVVAFEADDLDVEEQLGWSVVVTGVARLVKDPGEAARYKDILYSWVAGEMDQVIRIRPEIITGFELVSDERFTGDPR
ncbi:pyridoxamine 5'-phosphate oxidase family protein [Nonomuraea aurantiaca]|uniref:pyridoxamine 5'-phosphate oxidase family protein n=1 Tax=Nonomuraea aurantiaca TaxID=2878562 RepID=UPI001CD95877|nr:pyridoxamine 5'-phosphate oxidase family protein [Nonomuraea aurantiaca]MCA2229225.1 pyridoxamine 5'-phosphate oxidase family protein [Nonomuraea aurantiaca]